MCIYRQIANQAFELSIYEISIQLQCYSYETFMLNYTNAVNAVKSVRFVIRSRCVTFRANIDVIW